MPDFNLTDKRIYQLLKHPYQVEKSVVENMTSAYMEFVKDFFDYRNREKDNKELIRNLNTSYIDFGTLKSLEESSPTENSKLKIIFLDKLMSLIDMETELVYRQMEYPKFFINIDTGWKSPLYLNHDIIKQIDIMELVCGLYYLENGVTFVDGKEIHFTDLTSAFERLFNIKFSDIYKKEVEVIKRKPNKRTAFLDRMKNSIIRKCTEEGYSI